MNRPSRLHATPHRSPLTSTTCNDGTRCIICATAFRHGHRCGDHPRPRPTRRQRDHRGPRGGRPSHVPGQRRSEGPRTPNGQDVILTWTVTLPRQEPEPTCPKRAKSSSSAAPPRTGPGRTTPSKPSSAPQRGTDVAGAHARTDPRASMVELRRTNALGDRAGAVAVGLRGRPEVWRGVAPSRTEAPKSNGTARSAVAATMALSLIRRLAHIECRFQP